MPDPFLYDQLDGASRMGFLNRELPEHLGTSLNPKFGLRPYQVEAFARFLHCVRNDYPGKAWPLHFAFNMATGSGKTLIMAGLIAHLYAEGYRHFLFFVNSTNIIEKTKDNFLNPASAKYLFAPRLEIGGKAVRIAEVANFGDACPDDINICFTTIQKLHMDLTAEREDAITYEDFKGRRVVLIADEAHHINTSTKNSKQAEFDALTPTWENTVERIFRQDEDNLLLEFTATLDYAHSAIAAKYRNKVLFRYDLREFRNDRFSKDVYIVQSSLDESDRVLQALVLSQFKQEVAARHRINLKPVVLFKAQKTIAQSKQNKALFHDLIDGLSAESLAALRRHSALPLLGRAFDWFEAYGIGMEQLASRLRAEFAAERCLSVNEETEKEAQQLVLNSLEDRDNRIRAIFAVQKLNEGWDVLNLFDIVRCYSQRDGKGGKPGPTTISEAQLIGRGARYFPFSCEGVDSRYQRKFDQDLKHELRILEELHYHSIDDSRYISELRTALIQEGMIDSDELEFPLVLKDCFRETAFFASGLIYLNERLPNINETVKSFFDLGVAGRNHVHAIASGKGAVDGLLGGGDDTIMRESGRKDVPLVNIPTPIRQWALNGNSFFQFDNLRRYFPHLQSQREFMTSQAWLGGLEITFQGDDLYHIGANDMLAAVKGLLESIEQETKRRTTDFRGSGEFKPHGIAKVFHDKVLKLRHNSERADGDEAFVGDRDWYVFNANYGTSEEKSFVRMFERQIQKLREKYAGIYLVRNERQVAIYNFSDGQAFEPDFVLFLVDDANQSTTYQIFIEPKGKHLQQHDKWKQEFLKEITERYRDRLLSFGTGRKQRLIGVPFYNNLDENSFKDKLWSEVP